MNNTRVPLPAPTVLIVDSDVLVRMAVAAYLRDCGYRALESRTAAEAIRILECGVGVDVLFSDVNLSGAMDGFGLAQWIRRERPWTRVILTSSVRRTAHEAGALCENGPLLAKPYDHRDLEQRIRRLLAGSE
jgi:CheY-like chemotaxis protein